MGPAPGEPLVGADAMMWRDKDGAQGCTEGGTPENVWSKVYPLCRGED